MLVIEMQYKNDHERSLKKLQFRKTQCQALAEFGAAGVPVTANGNVTWCKHHGNLLTLNMYMTHNHAILLYVLKKGVLHKSKDRHNNGHDRIIYNSQKPEKAHLSVRNVMDKFFSIHAMEFSTTRN